MEAEKVVSYSVTDRTRRALAGKRTLVVGLGCTGVSAALFLHGCGAVVTASDALPVEKLAGARELSALGIAVRAGGEAVDTKGMDLVVVSPGVPSGSPLLERARADGAVVISEVELAYRFIDCPVLAVAGTNGKTTTTTLLGRLLSDAGKKVFVGGNIGTPAIEYVASGGGADLCVLELSSFHLETTDTFNPKAGILLNITEDHLDRYRDFDHYAETKFRLFENQKKGDWAIVNAGDPVIARRMAAWPGKGSLIPFSVSGPLARGLWLEGGEMVCSIEGEEGGVTERRFDIGRFALKGLHNIENIMAATCAALLMGVPQDSIERTLAGFSGLVHRMEQVRELGGVTYIDDSKGTNIGALIGALRSTDGPVILIAGGRDKGGDYGQLAQLVREKVKLLVLIGEAAPLIKASLGGVVETVEAAALEEAVAIASAKAAGGDTVLLCPACSSFDMFRDYKERGERFRAAVLAL